MRRNLWGNADSVDNERNGLLSAVKTLKGKTASPQESEFSR
jgi:hypothetical protein